MDNSEWVVALRAETLLEAEKARLRLAEAGIPSDLWDKNIIGLHPWLKHAVGGIRVVVPEDRLQDARRALDNLPEDTVSDDELTRQALASAPEPERVRSPRTQQALYGGVALFILLAIFAGVFLSGLSKK